MLQFFLYFNLSFKHEFIQPFHHDKDVIESGFFSAGLNSVFFLSNLLPYQGLKVSPLSNFPMVDWVGKKLMHAFPQRH